jgi:hypothetical protein
VPVASKKALLKFAHAVKIIAHGNPAFRSCQFQLSDAKEREKWKRKKPRVGLQEVLNRLATG